MIIYLGGVSPPPRWMIIYLGGARGVDTVDAVPPGLERRRAPAQKSDRAAALSGSV